MPGLIRRSASRVIGVIRRVLLGQLSAPEPIFSGLRKLEAEVGDLRHDVAKLAELQSVAADRATATPHAAMTENDLIDQQIAMAKYYMKTAMGDIAPGFSPIYERCKSYTTASVEQLYAIHTAVDYVVRAGIPGDIIDCGAGRGGSMMMAALTLGALGVLDRRIVMLDSYDMTPPGSDGPAIRAADVRRLIETSGYPLNLVDLTPGMVEVSAGALPAGKIAFLRLDTNNYGSTKTALSTLYPRIAVGGVLLTSDVGALAGPRQAMLDYLTGQRTTLLLTRVDYSTRMAVIDRASRSFA